MGDSSIRTEVIEVYIEVILEEILTLKILTNFQGPSSVWKEAGCTIFLH